MAVSDLLKTYMKCCSMDDQTANASGEAMEEMNTLGVAIRAQPHCLHSRLEPPKEKIEFEIDQEDIANTMAADLNRT
jgi:hypothetical protein